MFKRLIAWFKGSQEPSSPDETAAVAADESAAPPSGTSPSNRGFSVWTVGELPKVNPISKTVSKPASPGGTSRAQIVAPLVFPYGQWESYPR